MIKTFKHSLVIASLLIATPFTANSEENKAAENAAAKATEEVKTKNPHAGHVHKKIDKNDPKYKEYLEQQVKKHEERRRKIKEFDESDQFNKSLLSENLKHDVNLGSDAAPIKIVEYASLSCGHCKRFHEKVYYPLKKEYIDSGKVQMKYRHYPLNGSAVKGAMIVSCSKNDNKAAILGGLFKGQGQWAFAKNEAQLIDRLQTVALIAGLDKDEFQACYDNDKLQDEILSDMKRANKELKVESTPTIFVNGVRYNGARDFETIKLHIDSLLLKAKNK